MDSRNPKLEGLLCLKLGILTYFENIELNQTTFNSILKTLNSIRSHL